MGCFLGTMRGSSREPDDMALGTKGGVAGEVVVPQEGVEPHRAEPPRPGRGQPMSENGGNGKLV